VKKLWEEKAYKLGLRESLEERRRTTSNPEESRGGFPFNKEKGPIELFLISTSVHPLPGERRKEKKGEGREERGGEGR